MTDFIACITKADGELDYIKYSLPAKWINWEPLSLLVNSRIALEQLVDGLQYTDIQGIALSYPGYRSTSIDNNKLTLGDEYRAYRNDADLNYAVLTVAMNRTKIITNDRLQYIAKMHLIDRANLLVVAAQKEDCYWLDVKMFTLDLTTYLLPIDPDKLQANGGHSYLVFQNEGFVIGNLFITPTSVTVLSSRPSLDENNMDILGTTAMYEGVEPHTTPLLPLGEPLQKAHKNLVYIYLTRDDYVATVGEFEGDTAWTVLSDDNEFIVYWTCLAPMDPYYLVDDIYTIYEELSDGGYISKEDYLVVADALKNSVMKSFYSITTEHTWCDTDTHNASIVKAAQLQDMINLVLATIPDEVPQLQGETDLGEYINEIGLDDVDGHSLENLFHHFHDLSLTERMEFATIVAYTHNLNILGPLVTIAPRVLATIRYIKHCKG